jgi:hypothetical protein
MENHAKTAKILETYGQEWSGQDHLREICDELDRQGVPIPKTWAYRQDAKSRSWCRAVENYPQLVVLAIKDRLKAAVQQSLRVEEKLPQTSSGE